MSQLLPYLQEWSRPRITTTVVFLMRTRREHWVSAFCHCARALSLTRHLLHQYSCYGHGPRVNVCVWVNQPLKQSPLSTPQTEAIANCVSISSYLCICKSQEGNANYEEPPPNPGQPGDRHVLLRKLSARGTNPFEAKLLHAHSLSAINRHKESAEGLDFRGLQ